MESKTMVGCVRAAIGLACTAIVYVVLQMATAQPAYSCNYGNNGEVGGGCGTVTPPPPPPGNPPQDPCSDQCACGNGSSGSSPNSTGNGGPAGSSSGGGMGAGNATRGHPVALFSGREMLSVTDMVVAGVMPINIVRQYDSTAQYDSPLGYGWALNLDKRLYKYADNSVVIRTDCGVRNKYVNAGGAYQSQQKGVQPTLVENTDGTFTLTYPQSGKETYDKQGRLTSKLDAQGNRLVFTYDTRGRLPLTGSSPFSINPAVPSIVSYDYRLIKIEEKLAAGTMTGKSVTLTYNDTTGRVQKIRANDGREVSYTHDQTTTAKNGNLLTVTGLAGINASFEYTDAAYPHAITKSQVGTETAYINQYEAGTGKVIKQTHGQDVLDFTYSPLKTVVKHTIKNSAGTVLNSETTTYVFDGNGLPKTIEWALSSGEKYKKELIRNTASGLVETENVYDWPIGGSAYALTRAVTYQYDTANNKISEAVTLAGGEVITKSWTYQNGWVSSEQVVSSLTPTKIFRTEYTFYTDSSGKPKNIMQKRRRTDSGSFLTTAYAYDSNGQLTTMTLPDGLSIRNVYTAGQLTSTYLIKASVNLPQLQKTFSYDSYGNLNSVTDANGNKTTLLYDDQKRITEIVNALSESIVSRYTGKQLTETEVGRTVASGEGQATQRTYTAEGWLQSIKRKKDDGSFITVATFTYNSEGKPLTLVSYRDGVAQTTNYQYDALGRLTKITDPAGNATQYRYDAMSNRIGMTDAKNRETAYTYDALNRLTQTEQKGVAPSAITKFTYDAAGNLLTVTDPENKTTTYTYDALSRRTKVTQPMGQAVTYAYDNGDRIDYVVNARNQKIDYTYASWGGLDRVDYYATKTSTTSIKRVQYAYDNNGNITSVADNTISATPLYTYTYDALNRIDVTTVGYLPMSVTLDNDYDRYGNRSQLVLNDGQVATSTFSYDKLNQLTNANFPGNQAFSFSYFQDADLLKRINYPSGINTTYQYGTNGLVQNIKTTATAGTLDDLTYSYDPALNITAINSTRDGGTNAYGYDGLDHLTSATRPAGYGIADESYEYDRVGNREQPGDATAYSYDNNNRITQSPGLTYTYDADGNQTGRSDGSVLGFDADNRLISYTKGGVSASYTYDPFGRRIRKIVDGNATSFLWDMSQLQSEYIGSSRQTRYATLPTWYSPVQVQDVNGILGVHGDHLEMARFLTNNVQGIVWGAKNYAFGKTQFANDLDGDGTAFVFNPRLSGQYYDPETDFHYNFYRYYEPALGRYLQADPIGLVGGVNVYLYVEGNPMTFIDPLGLRGVMRTINNTFPRRYFPRRGNQTADKQAQQEYRKDCDLVWGCPPPNDWEEYCEWHCPNREPNPYQCPNPMPKMEPVAEDDPTCYCVKKTRFNPKG